MASIKTNKPDTMDNVPMITTDGIEVLVPRKKVPVKIAWGWKIKDKTSAKRKEA